MMGPSLLNLAHLRLSSVHFLVENFWCKRLVEKIVIVRKHHLSL